MNRLAVFGSFRAFVSLCILVVLCGIGGTNVHAQQEPALQKIRLQLFWKHQFEFAGFYAAIEQGYYRDAGIELEFVPFDSNSDHIDSVISGGADIGLSGISVIERYHQGESLILLNSFFKQSPLVLITHPEISSLEQLLGKKVHAMQKLITRGSIHEMLAFHNVNSHKIETVFHENPVLAFNNKEVSAIVAFTTDLPFKLNQQNIPFKIYDPNQYGLVTQDMNLFTTKHYVTANRVLIERFMKATKKGWQYALENPNEVVSVIKENYDEQDLSTDALMYEAKAIEKLFLPNLYDIGEVLKNKISLISHRLIESGEIKRLNPIDEFIFKEESKISKFKEALSDEEIQFLEKFDVISVQNESDYPPFNYQSNSKPIGFSVDYLNLISNTIGKEFKFVQGNSWHEYLAMLENKELDMVVNILKNPSREKFATFTEPFAIAHNFVVTRETDKYQDIDIETLKAGRIAVVKGYADKHTLEDKYAIKNILEVENSREAFESVLRNEADFFIANGAVAKYHIENYFLSGLKLNSFSKSVKYPEISLRLATHKDNVVLANILDKAIQQISEKELIKLRKKWFGSIGLVQTSTYTQKEIEYIDSNQPVLCRIDISEGNDRTVELIDIITRDSGLKIKLSPFYSWQQALTAVNSGQCDILPYITKTKKRAKELLFTDAYTNVQQSIITKKEVAVISNFDLQLDKTFVVIQGDVLIDKLKASYPQIKLKHVEYPIDAAREVSQGRAFGYIGSYYIQTNMLNNYTFKNLKLNNILRARFDDLQSIAISKSSPLLKSILNKSLANVDKQEIRALLTQSAVKVGLSELLNKDEIELANDRTIILCNSGSDDIWQDFINLISQNSPIKLVKSEPLPWAQAIDALKQGKCDFLPEMSETQSRRKYFVFTPPFHQEPRVIATLNEQPFITSFDAYIDQTFVIEEGELLKELLLKEFPSIRLVEVERAAEAIDMVRSKKAFAFLANISTVASTLQRYAIDDIKVAGTLADRYNDHWSIATRKEDVLLSSLLTKIIQVQDKKTLQNILSSQSAVKYQNVFDYSIVWKISIAAMFIITIFIFWNRRLALLNQQLSLAKQETEEAQKLVVIQEKLSSLGTLTAGVAHEINNPVNFMHASVYMMEEEIERIKAFLRELAGGDNAEPEVIESFEKEFKKLSELAKTAMQGSNRVKTIVNDLRMFSRLEDEKQESAKLAALIQSTVHLVRTQYVDIEFEVDCPFDPSLTCYPAKLSQVFMNVIVNACQAIESRIEREPDLQGKIYVSMTEVDKHVIVSFEDNGSGMDEKTMQQIFDPFYTTKDVGKGTGLGMSISFGIIEEHQGKINISSKVNAGTVIEVHLPVL